MQFSYDIQPKTKKGMLKANKYVQVHLYIEISNEQQQAIKENDLEEYEFGHCVDIKDIPQRVTGGMLLHNNHLEREVWTDREAKTLIAEVKEGLTELKNELDLVTEVDSKGSFEI